jgi:hypothetical protein
VIQVLLGHAKLSAGIYKVLPVCSHAGQGYWPVSTSAA